MISRCRLRVIPGPSRDGIYSRAEGRRRLLSLIDQKNGGRARAGRRAPAAATSVGFFRRFCMLSSGLVPRSNLVYLARTTELHADVHSDVT